MLTIATNDGEVLSWDVNTKRFSSNFRLHECEKVMVVVADGPELAHILSRYRNLPRLRSNVKRIRWYGDHAKFIVSNLQVEW